MPHKNEKYLKNEAQQDSFINEIRAIEEKMNKTKQNQDLS